MTVDQYVFTTRQSKSSRRVYFRQQLPAKPVRTNIAAYWTLHRTDRLDDTVCSERITSKVSMRSKIKTHDIGLASEPLHDRHHLERARAAKEPS